MPLRDQLLEQFPRLRDLPAGCWVVGGAIRDLLLGIRPVDVDVASRDPESAARTAGSRLIRLGTAEHLSAWRVVEGGHVYDFAALEGGAIETDLARRDFTINAMALALDDGGLVDPHRGQADLRAGIVRMIDPTNFDDDPLRCVKAVRMAVRFGFEIDRPTLDAIRTRAARIVDVAPERVTYELSLIFSAGRFRTALALLGRSGLDEPLFGRKLGAADFHGDDVSLPGAMALLVRDPRGYARRWRWSGDLLRQVIALQRLLSAEGDQRVALYDAGESIARQLPPLLRALLRDHDVDMPDFTIQPALSGEEISALSGLAAGPELGRLKRALLEAQVRGEVTSRQEAEEFVRR